MSEFYIHDDWAVKRCLESHKDSLWISVAGVDVSDLEVKLFVGVVHSIGDCGEDAAYGRRYRVTMRHEAT